MKKTLQKRKFGDNRSIYSLAPLEAFRWTLNAVAHSDIFFCFLFADLNLKIFLEFNGYKLIILIKINWKFTLFAQFLHSYFFSLFLHIKTKKYLFYF